MTNSVDPDQTAPIGAVCSGYMLFASILNLSVIAADYFSRRHFQMYFFLGALRANCLLDNLACFFVNCRILSKSASVLVSNNSFKELTRVI